MIFIARVIKHGFVPIYFCGGQFLFTEFFRNFGDFLGISVIAIAFFDNCAFSNILAIVAYLLSIFVVVAVVVVVCVFVMHFQALKYCVVTT